MKTLYFLLIVLGLSSCNNEKNIYQKSIYNKGQINKLFLSEMDDVEMALLKWYLYAYGNECSNESDKVKCELLGLMNISNECDSEYREMLDNYLAFNKIIAFKLKKCPVLPIDGPIQNTIESLSMCRNADLISITIKAKGLNNAQEKHWNIEQTETFRIAGDKLKIEYGNDCCK